LDLEARVQRLRTAIETLTSRVQSQADLPLYDAPAPEDWTIMRVLAHVAEILPYWSQQARDVAARTENNLPFGRTAEDPDRIAWVENHARDTLADVLKRIDAGLDDAIRTMRSLPAEAWDGRTARHPRRGEMSIAQIFDDFVIAHAEEHLAQAQRTLDRLASKA
jgi:hypothetical protein